MRMLLAEKLMYLAIDNTTNRLYLDLNAFKFEKVLYAALLVDLEFKQKISITSYEITVVDLVNCQRQILTDILNEIISYSQKRSPNVWIEWFLGYFPNIIYRMQMEMVNHKLLVNKATSSDFGALAGDSFEITNNYEKSQLIDHIEKILNKEAKLSSYDRCLIGLASSCSLLEYYIDFSHNPSFKQFLNEITSALPILSNFDSNSID